MRRTLIVYAVCALAAGTWMQRASGCVVCGGDAVTESGVRLEICLCASCLLTVNDPSGHVCPWSDLACSRVRYLCLLSVRAASRDGPSSDSACAQETCPACRLYLAAGHASGLSSGHSICRASCPSTTRAAFCMARATCVGWGCRWLQQKAHLLGVGPAMVYLLVRSAGGRLRDCDSSSLCAVGAHLSPVPAAG